MKNFFVLASALLPLKLFLHKLHAVSSMQLILHSRAHEKYVKLWRLATAWPIFFFFFVSLASSQVKLITRSFASDYVSRVPHNLRKNNSNNNNLLSLLPSQLCHSKTLSVSWSTLISNVLPASSLSVSLSISVYLTLLTLLIKVTRSLDVPFKVRHAKMNKSISSNLTRSRFVPVNPLVAHTFFLSFSFIAVYFLIGWFVHLTDSLANLFVDACLSQREIVLSDCDFSSTHDSQHTDTSTWEYSAM